MKKKLFYLFALIGSMSLFVACSDDDNPDYTQVIDTEIAGDYKGDLNVKVDATDMGTLKQRIKVEKAGSAAVNLSIKNFSFMGIPVGDIVVKDCPLSESNGSYTFTGSTELNNLGGMELDATVEAKGSVTSGRLSLDLPIKATLAGQAQEVKVTFAGTKMTGTEKSGADILGFTFDNTDAVTEQPVINSDNTITFKVNESADVTALVPTITVSEGATVTPGTGEPQNFSAGKTVTYTVVSEDYGTTKTYTVSAGTQSVLKFSFEEWEVSEKNDVLLPKDIWASSASGASLLGGTLLKQEAREDGTFAAKMITFEFPNPNALIPGITAGSIFIGKFDLMAALKDRLSSTKFGYPVETVGLKGQPVRLKGMYKYQAGERYLDASDYENVIETKDVDKGSIVAVLYKAKDAEGNDVTLTAHDVNSSEHIVGYASVITENTSEYVPIDVEFEYKNSYNPEEEYKFAIVCSSSKDGDYFKGAGGSTLIVDELEVITE